MQQLTTTNNRPATNPLATCLAAGALVLLLASCMGSGLSGAVELQSPALKSVADMRNQREKVISDHVRGYPHTAGLAALRLARTYEEGGPVEPNLAYAFVWYEMAERLNDKPGGLFDEPNPVWGGHAREKKLALRQHIAYQDFQPVPGYIQTCWGTEFRTCPGDELTR